MDTSNIVLWVSACERNVNVKDFALTALLKLYGKFIKVSSSMYRDLYFSVIKYRIYPIIPAKTPQVMPMPTN